MLKSVSIKAAVAFAFGALVLAISALSLYFYLSMTSVRGKLDEIVESNISLLQSISNLRYSTVTYRRFALDYGLTESAAEHRSIRLRIDSNNQAVERYLREMSQLARSAEQNSLVADISQRVAAYRRQQESYLSMIDQRRIEEARQEILTNMLGPFDQLVERLTQLQEQIALEAQQIKQAEVKRVDRVLWLSVLVCVLLGAFALLMAGSIARKINLPLQLLKRQIEQVGDGQLAQQLRLNDFQRDELGQLAQSFTKMQQNMISLVEQVNASLQPLQEVSNQVSQRTEHDSQAIDQQQGQYQHIAAAMTQMASTFAEMSVSTHQAAVLAGQVASQAQESQQVVSQSALQIDQAAADIGQAAELAVELRQDSDNIGSISAVIRQIADQTNLLALNAAIEAARAGEQGRGFAVVADEVRQLATRTQSSIDQINTITQGLQARTEQVGQALQVSCEVIQNSVQHAREASVMIADVSQSVSQISAMNAQIDHAIGQQNQVNAELEGSVNNLSQSSVDLANGANQTRMATEQLARLTQALKKAVGVFRL